MYIFFFIFSLYECMYPIYQNVHTCIFIKRLMILFHDEVRSHRIKSKEEEMNCQYAISIKILILFYICPIKNISQIGSHYKISH